MSRRTKISGLLLRELRRETGLTQYDLATRIGISRETVSAIENDKRETIEAIGAEVISKWHMICAQSASADTRNKFFEHVMKYFGFSDQHLVNRARDITNHQDKSFDHHL
ncbi:MAG: helix-turn-helix transcriptional regulator [Paraglaciecola sp.]|nr:helix-turn-helix transcriptional regulator [Paraglaciecola sp.]